MTTRGERASPGEIGAVLPPAWLTPIWTANSATIGQSGPTRPADASGAIGYDDEPVATALHHVHG
jgi:hypothetical protein